MGTLLFIFAASLYARNLKEKRKAEEYVEFFKDAGLAFYMRYDLTLPVEENIKNKLLSGMTRQQTANEVGISIVSLYNYLKLNPELKNMTNGGQHA